MDWKKDKLAENKNRQTIFSRLPKEPNYNFEVAKIREWMYERVRVSSFECLGTISVIEEIDDFFMLWPYRGTTSSLEEFLERYQIPFRNKYLTSIDKEAFLDFCETILNMFSLIENTKMNNPVHSSCLDQLFNLISEQIDAATDGMNYTQRSLEDGRIVLVKKDSIADSIALNEPEIADQIMMYRHRSLQGDIEGKRGIILAISRHVEPLLRNRDFEQLMKTVVSDVGYALNNMNIRHNNINGPNKKSGIDEINPQAYERHLDGLFTLLLVVLQGRDIVKIHNEFSAIKEMTK